MSWKTCNLHLKGIERFITVFYTLILGTYLMLGLYSVAAIVYLNLGKSCWRSQSMMEIWVFKNEEARIPAGVGYDFLLLGRYGSRSLESFYWLIVKNVIIS